MNEESRGLSLPRFFTYYSSPVKLVATTDGGVAAWRLSKDTGGWRPATNLIDKLLFIEDDEISELTRDEFVQHTEHDRAYYRNGDGAVSALYETAMAVEDAALAERRSLTLAERALVKGIRRKTFVMFEEELQRKGDPGADPTVGAAG